MNESIPDRPRRRKRSRTPVERKSVRSITGKLPTLCLLLAALGLMAMGARMATSGLAHYQTQAFLANWVAAAKEPNPRAWTIAEEAAQRAVAWYPVANGVYLDQLGLVHSWQHFRQPYGALDARNSRMAALDAYRAAVEARPTWPDTWARLAHAKLYLLAFDDEFDHALLQASVLGPWRIGINRELTEIGFTAWPQLDVTQRVVILELARRTVAYNAAEAKRTYQLAEYTGMTDVLCQSLNTSLRTNRGLCQE
ncbi:hypothetical protein [Stutzerimonas stutzeri]|uniref:hypothetical protein n=1 Tax=Stutzerimonas stutzeri TaxID=316 RepID=UPI0024B6E04E|nr:hypothetical protein [Stutzerimonas stutzeri]MDI9728287.1 hypothetical protein [Stutzerimonas stutzeri]MDI9749127.1 hypothetical protein [Stutzerimonas stutzeri]